MAELGSKLLIPNSVQFLLSAIAGTREVGEGHSGVGGREVEGGMPGPSLPGSQAFFLLAQSSGPEKGAWVRFSPAVWLALLSSRMGLWGLYGGRSQGLGPGCQHVGWVLPGKPG